MMGCLGYIGHWVLVASLAQYNKPNNRLANSIKPGPSGIFGEPIGPLLSD